MPHQSLQTTATQAKRRRKSRELCPSPKEGSSSSYFHYSTGWRSQRECDFYFPARGSKGKMYQYFTRLLQHWAIYVSISNITKAFKPFVWSVNKQKAKSNPFRPNLRPGKSLTKQNSPGTCSSGCFGSPFPRPSLLFLSFCFFSFMSYYEVMFVDLEDDTHF